MQNRLLVVMESNAGLNTEFYDALTKEFLSLSEVKRRVNRNMYPGYTVVCRNGIGHVSQLAGVMQVYA